MNYITTKKIPMITLESLSFLNFVSSKYLKELFPLISILILLFNLVFPSEIRIFASALVLIVFLFLGLVIEKHFLKEN